MVKREGDTEDEQDEGGRNIPEHIEQAGDPSGDTKNEADYRCFGEKWEIE